MRKYPNSAYTELSEEWFLVQLALWRLFLHLVDIEEEQTSKEILHFTFIRR
jgi:hypothetical protein